jgi:hypothetical protein
MRLRWKYAVTIGLCAVLIMGGLWFLDARRERAQLISLFSTSITIQARAIRDIFEVSGDPNRVQAVIMAAIGTGVVDVLRVVDRRSVVLASSRRDEIGKIFNMPVVFGGAILSDGAKPYYMKEMTGVLEIGETKAIVAIVPYAAHVKSPYAETETGIIGGGCVRIRQPREAKGLYREDERGEDNLYGGRHDLLLDPCHVGHLEGRYKAHRRSDKGHRDSRGRGPIGHG